MVEHNNANLQEIEKLELTIKDLKRRYSELEQKVLEQDIEASNFKNEINK
jgi:SMC interacting uncharacterized protein involved in chromosome segregation